MEITAEMKNTLEKLSKVNLDFLEFVKKEPETLKRSNFRALDLDSHIYRLQSWPTFINRETRESFQDIGGKVCDLIKKIPARLFDNDPEKIGAYFEIPAKVVRLQLEGVTRDHLVPLVGRTDFTFSPSGLKCLEFNVSANVSGWQLPDWEALYLKTPIISKFIKEYRVKVKNENFMGLFLEHVIQSSLHLVNGRGENAELNLAVAQRGYRGMDMDKTSMLANLRRLYKEQLSRRSLKGSVILCDYPHLEFPDHEVHFEGKRIHALTELYHGLVPPGVMRAFTAGNLRLLNGPVCGLLSNKLNLALLSEYEDSDTFSEEERAVIKKYVPWTRKIIPGEAVYKGEKITMENFLISHKDRLVIKPSMGMGGEGVYIGQGASAKQWEDVVNTALHKKNYLVQELVETPPGLYQLGEEGCAYHDTVWGVWFLGSQYGASFVRALPGGNTKRVINSFQGASISVVFEVDN